MSGASSAGQARTRSSVLTPRGPVSLTLSQDHNPATFYRTRSGLYVWGEFRSRIVSRAKAVQLGTNYSLTILELQSALTDVHIGALLRKEHFFEESAVCAIVAEMVSKQPDGESGHLENTSSSNLLFTGLSVVDVCWSTHNRDWDVATWNRCCGSRWDVGSRVLCPT